GEGNGSLYISGSSANYWSNSQRTTSYSAGYSNSWRRINYNINVQRTMEQSLFNGGATRTNNTISLNVSIPLGKAGSNAPSMSTS
ncbi:fimbria/pilus outer membrane usher protein, partial [Photobacterium sp. DNB22_13_2]